MANICSCLDRHPNSKFKVYRKISIKYEIYYCIFYEDRSELWVQYEVDEVANLMNLHYNRIRYHGYGYMKAFRFFGLCCYVATKICVCTVGFQVNWIWIPYIGIFEKRKLKIHRVIELISRLICFLCSHLCSMLIHSPFPISFHVYQSILGNSEYLIDFLCRKWFNIHCNTKSIEL